MCSGTCMFEFLLSCRHPRVCDRSSFCWSFIQIWSIVVNLYSKSSYCWSAFSECLDNSGFVLSPLLAHDLSHGSVLEPTCSSVLGISMLLCSKKTKTWVDMLITRKANFIRKNIRHYISGGAVPLLNSLALYFPLLCLFSFLFSHSLSLFNYFKHDRDKVQ